MYLFVQLHQVSAVACESLTAACELLAVAGGIYFPDQQNFSHWTIKEVPL